MHKEASMYILKKLNRETTASTKEEAERLVLGGWKIISGEDKKEDVQADIGEADEELQKEEQQQSEQEKPKRTSKNG